ncbi:MAG: hypothetical protein WDN49_10110 [Acetobacteraceae bacterium]
MSLAWQAALVYGGPQVPAQIQDPTEQGRYMDLLFGDPAHGPGLGLNVARYKHWRRRQPGPKPLHSVRRKHGLLPEAQIEGFLTGPGGPYDWSRDASQRRMLHEAQARGATLFEAFSNSAPWWIDRQRLRVRR